jgi:hypothetical protein
MRALHETQIEPVQFTMAAEMRGAQLPSRFPQAANQ